MRSIFHALSVCFSAVAMAVFIAGIAPADPSKAATAPVGSSGIVLKDSGEGKANQPNAQLPTPAKSLPTGAARDASDSSGVAIVQDDGSTTVESPKPNSSLESSQSKPTEEPLHPEAEPADDAPAPIEAASFKGVIPGTSTRSDVAKTWGPPKKSAQAAGDLVELHAVEPFQRVEVRYADGKVASIVIRFDRTFPAEAVAKQLGLSAIRPVAVRNELGETLGLAFPERGVLFAFEPGEDPAKPTMKVAQIVLEPLSAEPFVLRAETTFDERGESCRRDLEQALALEPGNARAHWMLGRVLADAEQFAKATVEAAEAVRLEPDNAQYRVSFAQTLAQSGRLIEAVLEAQKAVAAAGDRPHIKARALCLVGDLVASGPKPDFRKALEFHTQAIEVAGPLKSDPHPAIRVAAKEVLVDAHLGAAHDIAWGDWKEKSKAVVRWLDRARSAAEDLVANEGGSAEKLFRVHVRVLATCVGVRGEIDPAPVVQAAVSLGDELIAKAAGPAEKARLQCELGMALYDAVQVCQMRADLDNALKHGESAAGYMEAAMEAKAPGVSPYLLGRLYFRLGTIHALRDRDHKSAVEWFDKAVPLLEKASAEELAGELGKHGEAFVGMGVSYWEIGSREKALALTQKGVRYMEQAVKQGSFDRGSLAVPYGNLAAMHRKLGAKDKAERYQELASRAKAELK